MKKTIKVIAIILTIGFAIMFLNNMPIEPQSEGLSSIENIRAGEGSPGTISELDGGGIICQGAPSDC